MTPVTPTTVGRARITINVSTVVLAINASAPLISTGSVVAVSEAVITLGTGSVFAVIREPSFVIAPINFNLSDQSVSVSLGNFPL
jgi:hypothetical protein